MLSNHHWWRTNFTYYMALFFITAIVIFLPYALTGTSLVWQSDGITQHLPALMQWQSDLQHLFSTGSWPTQWTWQVGLGTDYYQTFSYYTLGDIFSYGVGFVSAQHVLAYYEWMLLLRLFLAGVSALVAIKYFTHNTNPWINASAALMYVFTGYTAFSAFEHPFFINPLIILPLLIVSFDYFLTTKKMVPFVLMVFWTLWNNYYFAFMMLLGLAIYWAIQTTIRHQWLNWRLHIRMIIAGVTGAMMAMLLFLPNVLGVLSSSRSGAPLANGLTIYPIYYYLALPGTILGNAQTPNFWFTGGFAIVLILGLIFTARRWRKYPVLASIWLISGIGLLIPAFAGIFNGGSSPSNRWTFMLALPLAIAAVYFLAALPKLDKKDWYSFIGFGLLASLSLFITTDFSLQSPFGLFIAMYVVILLVLYAFRNAITPKQWALLTLMIVMNVILIMSHTHEDDLNPNKTPMLSRDAVQSLIKQQTRYPTEHVTDTESLQRSMVADPLHNMAGIAPGNNMAMLSNAHPIDSYWSYQMGSVGHVMSDLGILTSTNNDVVSDLDHRSLISHILGVQQVFQNTKDPNIANYTKDSTINNQTRRTTNHAYPLAYIAPNTVATATYTQASPSEKEAFLVDSVVTDTVPEQISKDAYKNELLTTPISQYQSKEPRDTINYSYTTTADNEDVGIYMAPNAKIKDTELHLELTNIQFEPQSLNGRYQSELADYKFKHETYAEENDAPDMRYNPDAFKWHWYKNNISNLGSTMSGYSITAKYAGNTQKFVQTSQKNLSFFNPRDEVTINLGPAKDVTDTQFIPLTFSQPGTYRFDVKIVAVPTDKRFTDKAAAIKATGVPFDLEADRLVASYKSKQPQIITTSIPYSTGWHSNTNDLIKVNGGFLGIQATPGDNKIEITYRTPGQRIGLVLSLLGLTMFLTLIIYEYWFKYKKHM